MRGRSFARNNSVAMARWTATLAGPRLRSQPLSMEWRQRAPWRWPGWVGVMVGVSVRVRVQVRVVVSVRRGAWASAGDSEQKTRRLALKCASKRWRFGPPRIGSTTHGANGACGDHQGRVVLQRTTRRRRGPLLRRVPSAGLLERCALQHNGINGLWCSCDGDSDGDHRHRHWYGSGGGVSAGVGPRDGGGGVGEGGSVGVAPWSRAGTSGRDATAAVRPLASLGVLRQSTVRGNAWDGVCANKGGSVWLHGNSLHGNGASSLEPHLVAAIDTARGNRSSGMGFPAGAVAVWPCARHFAVWPGQDLSRNSVA